MSHPTNAVCFTCGLVIEEPPRLSRLTNGQVCPACRERVLDGLPAALPSRPSGARAGGEALIQPLERPEPEERDFEVDPDGWGSGS